MKKLTLLVLSCFSLGQVLGQVFSSENNYLIDNLNSVIDLKNSTDFDKRDELIEGSRYYDKEFAKSSVMLKDGKWYSELMLRYDAYEDLFEIKQNDKIMMLPSSADITKIVMNNDTIIPIKVKVGNKEIYRNYYQVEKGELSLYIRRAKTFVDAQKPRGYEDAKPAKFVDVKDEYYWTKKGQNDLQKVGNKKSTAAYLPEIDVLTYLKKEKVSLNKIEGLTKFVNHYNNSIK